MTSKIAPTLGLSQPFFLTHRTPTTEIVCLLFSRCRENQLWISFERVFYLAYYTANPQLVGLTSAANTKLLSQKCDVRGGTRA